MKKLLLILVPFMVLLISFKSKCASQEDITNLKNKVSTSINITLSDSFATQIIDKWQTTGYVNCWVNKDTHGTVQVTLANNYTMQQGNYHPQTNYINTGWISPSTTSTVVWNNQTPGSYISGVSGYSCYVGKWEDFHTIPIDWDTVYYSANIQAPNFDVTYRELSSTPIVDVPLDVHMNFVPNNVYIEMDAVYRIPERIDAVYGRIGGYQYYTNPNDKAHLYHKVINKEDLVLASNASESYIHLALNDAWEELYDLIPISDLDWYFAGDYSQDIKNNLMNRYENLRKICCFYGNEIQIIVRYFTIVNDTQFVVGPWRIWDCAKPNSFTDELPTWYEPYLPASGTTATSTNTGSNTQSEPDVITIPYGDGDPTGVYYNPTTTITVNPNVPNYPDYPTIATYNKDHLLVDAMNGVKSLNGFFGEMVEFLTVSFAFIPSYIWTIIAVGFSLSIIVMFLKIL